MSEAVRVLQRTLGAYNAQATQHARQLEKADADSDEERAARHNIDAVAGRIADLHAALKILGGSDMSESDPHPDHTLPGDLPPDPVEPPDGEEESKPDHPHGEPPGQSGVHPDKPGKPDAPGKP